VGIISLLAFPIFSIQAGAITGHFLVWNLLFNLLDIIFAQFLKSKIVLNQQTKFFDFYFSVYLTSGH